MASVPVVYPRRPTPYYPSTAPSNLSASMHPYFPATTGTGSQPHPAFMNSIFPYTVTLNNWYFNASMTNNNLPVVSPRDSIRGLHYRSTDEDSASGTGSAIDLSADAVRSGSLPSSPGSVCSDSDRSLNTSGLNSSAESLNSPKPGM